MIILPKLGLNSSTFRAAMYFIHILCLLSAYFHNKLTLFQAVDSENVTITFTVNGASQATAVVIPRADFPEDGFALFPHVLSRNYAFELNLGSRDEPWFPNPDDLDDYIYLDKVEEKIAGPVRPETRSECEVKNTLNALWSS